MSLHVVLGDRATTTSLALAATWPDVPGGAPLLVELDPTGGSAAAWLSMHATPSLSTLAAAARRPGGQQWGVVEAHIRRAASGIGIIPAPLRTIEARRAVDEAAHCVVPQLADAPLDVIVDAGAFTAGVVPDVVTSADTVVLVHRQDDRSAAAEGVRIERLVEQLESLLPCGPVVTALIGDRPFAPSDIAAFAGQRCDSAVEHAELADDPLAAAVFAGRVGVSPRRLRRLPLLRSAHALARRLADETGALTSRGAA